MRHLYLRPGLAGEELKRQADRLAGENIGSCERRLADFGQLAVLVAVEFERPGVAVDDQQFHHAEAAVEGDFVAGALAGTDDLDQEIGRPAPVRVAVDRLAVAEKHGHVGLAKVLLPAFVAVAEVHAGKDATKPGLANDFPKYRRQVRTPILGVHCSAAASST